MSNLFSSRNLVLAFFAAGIGIWAWQAMRPAPKSAVFTVDVRVPELSPAARTGKVAFDSSCAACHGVNAAGSDKGPPLVHDIYNPGHHADEAFFVAAKRGVRRHHWRFGDMPPLEQVSEPEIAAIVRYVRELQAANGITYREHRM